jgi:hypothetical protein
MPHVGAASLGRRCLGHHLLAPPDLSERKREIEKKRGKEERKMKEKRNGQEKIRKIGNKERNLISIFRNHDSQIILSISLLVNKNRR